MKKVYVLLSAACVAISASAVEKEMAVGKTQLSASPMVKESVAPKAFSTVKAQIQDSKNESRTTRASGDYLYFRPADNVMALGSSVNGYGYNVTFGFASSYGNLVFNNYSTTESPFEWIYTKLNDYEVVNNQASWNYSESEDRDLVIKSGIGEILPPELNVGDAVLTDATVAEYICGGAATYWGFEDSEGGEFGLTFYQNPGYRTSDGYSGSLTYMTSYQPNAKGYNAAGVLVNPKAIDPRMTQSWQTYFEERTGATVTDLAIDNFTFIQPAPASTYFMTKAWIQLNVEAKKATQLQSYIYPIDEEGYIEEMPIAIGYASIARGDKNYAPIFYYYPLDENGDEIEGEVFIDSAVAITVEGFAGNDAITAVNPASGYYPFSYSSYAGGNYDICREPMTYISFSFKADGETVSSMAFDRGLYYIEDNDDDTLSSLTYGRVTMDAVFPYIHEENDVDVVNIPVEGGSATVSLYALYYNIPALVEEGIYEVEAPEWIDVKIGALDEETQLVPMTVSVAASESDRSGEVTIQGIGASYTLTVNQGEGGAVNVVVADQNAVYYDLAGRKVANPDKGIYIKKAGNKTEKIIL